MGLLPPLPGLENKNETPDPGSPLLRRSDPGLHAFASPRLCFCNNQVNAVVLEQEGRELETLARDLEGLPPLALDAARHRLSLRSGEGVLFYSASKGSIVLCGVVAGLSAWILQQTLGETLKEAWVESDMHKKLKRLLLAGSRYKAEAIAQGIEKKRTIALGEQKRVELRANVDTGDGATIIYVYATLQGADFPPYHSRNGETGGPQERGSYRAPAGASYGATGSSRQGSNAERRGEERSEE